MCYDILLSSIVIRSLKKGVKKRYVQKFVSYSSTIGLNL